MKNLIKTLFIFIVFYCVTGMTFAQVQVVKGRILDSNSDYGLFGATILLLDSEPQLGSSTDENGYFRLEEVPIGRHNFLVQYIGYKSITLPNVLVTAGKEVVLEVKLEESVEKLEEVVVTADADKNLPINELAKVSARTFSLEEVTRFSGGRNDVARLAASFAGVSTPDDSRNDIVVRGNSPTGLLWRVEGLPIATTNHYATLGATGGPVSALNTNLLRTSDFITSAFPAEYGNANAAVFDVKFRNGNTDKHEFTGQLSAFSGAELMAEGPISRKNNSSYIASYRYGIASLAATGTSAIPIYQDFSFKLNFGESKLGRFELFGLGGLSEIEFLGDDIDDQDLFSNPNQDAFVDNQLGMLGLNHYLRLSKTAWFQTTLGVSTNQNIYEQDNLIKDESGNLIKKYRATNVENTENRYTFSTTFNKKFNARWNLKAGLLYELYDVNFFTEDRDNRADIPDDNNDSIPDFFVLVNDINDQYLVGQSFAQAEYKFSDKLSTTFGLHSQYHSFTEDYVIEPRFGLSWQYRPDQRLSFAYGLHSQSIPSPVLFFLEEVSPGEFETTNEDLEFTRSHHWVLAYDRNFGTDWRLKLETYYQYLFNVPVEAFPSSYSILNEGADFDFDERGSLVNEGTGQNYGVEMTLEKFFSRGYYALLTASLYESTYEGSDGIERNTAFNNNYVFNFLFGKEWKFGSGDRHAWTFDTRMATSGGTPYTPIDLEATRQNAGDEVLFENQAFEERLKPYFRWDVKFGVRLNSSRKNVSHQFFLDFQNVTNRSNEFARRYNEVTDEINVVEQIGFFPDFMYRIQF